MMDSSEEMGKFNFPIADKSENIIKVIGIGGGGGNAVQHMWDEGVKNVSFFVINTDSQVLSPNRVPNKVMLGDGLGAGGDPKKGKEYAEGSIDELKDVLGIGTKMVFITAGLGGGTGTGATPVVARLAKEMGILTVGVVTLPFMMEGKKRIDVALKGLEELKGCVDSLIVVNNEKLLKDDQYAELDWAEGMKKADEVLTIAVKTIAEIITVRGLVNRDFNDVNTVMRNGGAAIVSIAKASGENRIFKALSQAIHSSLVANFDIQHTKRLLYIIYSGTENPAKMHELGEINRFMEKFDQYIDVLWGHYPDDELKDEIKVSIIATGFDQEKDVLEDEGELYKQLRKKYYQTEEPEKEKEVVSEKDNAAEDQPAMAEEEPAATPEEKTAPKPTSFLGKLENLLNNLIAEEDD